MHHDRFWVVGGKYRDMSFADLIPGSESLYGPFRTRRDAEDAWRRVSERHRSQCLARFVIAAEGHARPLPAAGHFAA